MLRYFSVPSSVLPSYSTQICSIKMTRFHSDRVLGKYITLCRWQYANAIPYSSLVHSPFCHPTKVCQSSTPLSRPLDAECVRECIAFRPVRLIIRPSAPGPAPLDIHRLPLDQFRPVTEGKEGNGRVTGSGSMPGKGACIPVFVPPP